MFIRGINVAFCMTLTKITMKHKQLLPYPFVNRYNTILFRRDAKTRPLRIDFIFYESTSLE